MAGKNASWLLNIDASKRSDERGMPPARNVCIVNLVYGESLRLECWHSSGSRDTGYLRRPSLSGFGGS